MLYTLTAVLCVLVFFALLFLTKKAGGEKAVGKAEKVFAFLLLALVIVKGAYSDSFILPIDGSEDDVVWRANPYDLGETVSRWILAFSEAFVIASALFDSKAVRRVLIFFSLPLCILSLVRLEHSLFYLTEYLGKEVWEYGFSAPRAVRIAAAVAERVFTILIPLSYAFLTHRGEYFTKSAKRTSRKLLAVGILCSMPFYTLGTLFGVTDHVIGIGDPLQFAWIAAIFVGFLGIYLTFRGERIVDRRAFMAFMIITLAMHYSSIYLHGMRMNRLPFQLCNLATYLLLLLLFVRKQALFDFILVANCPGCVIAIATVTEDSPMFNFWAMHYYVQHTLVFIIPLLLAALGVFKMPKPKEAIRHYFVGFTVFYLFCFFSNAYVNGVLAVSESLNHEIFNTANFLYLTRCPVDALEGLYQLLRIGKITVFGTDFYLLYLLFIYVVFSLLSIGEYYFNDGIFEFFRKKKMSKAYKSRL